MVNGEWKDERARNDKCFTCLQDKSTTLKLIPMLQPKQLSFSPPTFYWNLNTIQGNNSIFFLTIFSSFFCFRNLIPSLYFSFLPFFFIITMKIKCSPTLAFSYYYTILEAKNTRSHYHCLANTTKQGWDGVGEQKKWLMSDQFKRAS